MQEISFDNLLRIIEILSILFGGSLVAFRVGRATQKMEDSIKSQTASSAQHAEEIRELRHEIKKLNDVLTQLALQEERIDRMDKMIDELRHGVGFITHPIPFPPPQFGA